MLLAKPVTQKIKPILFSGTRRATITPTDANVSARIRNETPPSPAKMSLARTWPGPITSSTSVGTAITTQRAHKSVARRRALR